MFRIVQSKKRDDLLTKFSFAVPVFHAYGHTAECQVCIVCIHSYMHQRQIHDGRS